MPVAVSYSLPVNQEQQESWSGQTLHFTEANKKEGFNVGTVPGTQSLRHREPMLCWEFKTGPSFCF